MRLDKFIASATQKSRADVRKEVLRGTVLVNGTVCKKIDAQVSEKDEIRWNGNLLSHEEYIYIMLDKPIGVVSASEDKNDKTVIDIVGKEYPRRNLFPAGRLDKASTGFVLITDDGNFAHDILAPKKHVPKIYEVEIDAPLTDEIIAGFENGVTLADGTKLAPAGVKALEDAMHVEVTLNQGVYHQIKRMFGVYDVGVNNLRRIAIGGVRLDKTLKSGEFRLLTQEEITKIR